MADSSLPHLEWRRPGFVITSDPDRVDLDLICDFLATTYWARDIPRPDLERALAASWVYSLRTADDRQIGFARAITDVTRFAWLSDVFVLPDWQGRGLGHWLVETVLSDPRLTAIRSWLLSTQDAHEVYRRFGWTEETSGQIMIRRSGRMPDPSGG